MDRTLLHSEQPHFSDAVSTMTSKDLTRLVRSLQAEMEQEKRRFAEIRQRLTTEAEAELEEALAFQLCLSQSRLADLCSKNIRCFKAQEQRKSLSALHREKKAQQTDHPPSQDQLLRLTASSILENISGGESTSFPSEKREGESLSLNQAPLGGERRRVYISRLSGEEEERKPLHLQREPHAVDREALEQTRTRILQQVKRTRLASTTPQTSTTKEERRSSSVQFRENRDVSPLPSARYSLASSPSKTPKSILKKRNRSVDALPSPESGDSGSEAKPLRSTHRIVLSSQATADEEEMDRKSPFTNSERSWIPSEPTTTDIEQRLNSANISTELRLEIGETRASSGGVTLKGSPNATPPQSHPPRISPNSGKPMASISFHPTDSTAVKKGKENHSPPPDEPIPPPRLPHSLDRTRVSISKDGEEKIHIEDNTVCREWDPTPLLNHLYKVDYYAKPETKRTRFTNMEGHLEHLPMGLRSSPVETAWKTHYFKTKEARLLWFQTPYADDCPLGSVVLSGAEVEINREENTLHIGGGRDGSNITLRCPLGLVDKWRHALSSHAASSFTDSYVVPLTPPIPHPTQNIAIIELGSCSIRGGVVTVEPSLPQTFFPSIAAKFADGRIMVGSEALKPENRHAASIVQPIKPTQLSVNTTYSIDVAVVREMLGKVFRDLHIQPSEYQVLLTVPQNAPTNLIGELMRCLLEEQRVEKVGVSRHPSLVLYSYDVTTGVVLDIGDRLNIVPIIDGFVVQNAIVSLPLGAPGVAESLKAKLCDENMGLYAFASTVEKYILRYILEEACYVANPSYDAEVEAFNASPKEKGTTVSLDPFQPTPEMIKDFKVGSARFSSVEGLFQPKKWGLDMKGLHQLVFNAIQASPMDSRRSLYRNIYLAGGCSQLPGLADRLEEELSALVAPSIHVRVHMSPWRYHGAYMGAQILASSLQFSQSAVDAKALPQFLRHLHASLF